MLVIVEAHKCHSWIGLLVASPPLDVFMAPSGTMKAIGQFLTG